MAQTDKAHNNRRLLIKNVRNISLVAVLGALLCVGGTLTYLNSRANSMLDEIQVNELPKVGIVFSHIEYDGTENAGKLGADPEKYSKHSTSALSQINSDKGMTTSFNISGQKYTRASDLRLVTHSVDKNTGKIILDSDTNYDNMIVQVRNFGAPAFIRVWISAPQLLDERTGQPLRKDNLAYDDASFTDDFVTMYWQQAPFPEPGAVPSDRWIDNSGKITENSNDGVAPLNANLVPFGYSGNFKIVRGSTKYTPIGNEASQYGKIVYHFAENWQDNWIYVGNSGYLSESDTTWATANTDFAGVRLDTEFYASGGYFVYKHILGVGGITAPLLTGISYSKDDTVSYTTQNNEMISIPKYNVDVPVTCSALTSLEETLKLAQKYGYGWGSGRTRATSDSDTSNQYILWDRDGKKITATAHNQQFSENKVAYSSDSSSSGTQNLTNQFHKWYEADQSLWYLVKDAIKEENTDRHISNGITFMDALHADVVTRE